MSGQATLARSANGSAARSSSAMNARKGTNTSVGSNRMALHQTPRAGKFNGTVLQQRSLKYTNQKTGAVVAKGTLKVYSQGGANFKAPAKMPARLNNTAAAAITSKRIKTVGVGVGVAVAPFGIPAGATTFAVGKQIGGKNNNYASLRLKASGYKVAGTGFGGKIKPASKNVQIRAAASLASKEGKAKAKGEKTVQMKIKVTDKYTGLSSKAPATVTIRKVNTGASAKSSGGNKANKGSGGNKTGRKNFRPRRDGNGKFAGSY